MEYIDEGLHVGVVVGHLGCAIAIAYEDDVVALRVRPVIDDLLHTVHGSVGSAHPPFPCAGFPPSADGGFVRRRTSMLTRNSSPAGSSGRPGSSGPCSANVWAVATSGTSTVNDPSRSES